MRQDKNERKSTYMNNAQLDEYLEMIIKLIEASATSVDEAVEIVKNAKIKKEK